LKNEEKMRRDFEEPDTIPFYKLADIAEITSITIILIFTIILKMFSLLRIFTPIGQFLEVFYKIVYAT